MNYKKLGNTDLDVSTICLGTMTWGEQNTEEEGFEQMDWALDHGVNFWDTAEIYSIPMRKETYGETERIIGNWFKRTNKRDKVVPDDFVDKNLIIIVAFQQWHQPLVDESISLLESNGFGDSHNIIEVPTVQKSSKLFEVYLDGIMRAGIRDDRIRDRTITAYVDLDQFLTNLDIPSNETIYWFLIEKDSKNILTRGYGIIAEEDLDLINSF